jgi:hypothetical protein
MTAFLSEPATIPSTPAMNQRLEHGSSPRP